MPLISKVHGISVPSVPEFVAAAPISQGIRNKNFKQKGHRQGSAWVWDRREFIAWDGEGTHVETEYNISGYREYQPQPFVTLGNSKGGRVSSPLGLSTKDCFELILNTKQEYPDSIFVGFGFGYDINQMLADEPWEVLERLYTKGTCVCGGYWIEWRPRKHFILRHRKSKRSAIIYDVFGFFQTSFLEACKEYLGNDDPDLDTIRKGKEDRDSFEWYEMDDKIVPYNNLELSMLVRVMVQLRQDLHDVGIDPSRWHGPGAIANEVLKKFNVPISRTVPEEVLDASQYAYAGGRFEHFWLGRYVGPVWEYDIHSAYPAAALNLPDLSSGDWEYVEAFEPDAFGVWYIEYDSGDEQGDKYRRPQPLFCRSENGSISYPSQVQGWYWTPEAGLCPGDVRGGWVFRPWSEAKPFSFVTGLYDERRTLKSQGKSAQRALKLILNSLYGKLAQTIGAGKKGPPRWHQLEYAGYITSYTRAMIYKAVSINPSAIIAVETDAVFSTEPLDLPVTDELGDWEQKEYKEIVYLQSGFYYATEKNDTIKCKYRGMDRDGETLQPVRLPYRTVLDRLARYSGCEYGPTTNLLTYTTRFIGLGMAIKTDKVWRSWEREPKQVSLDQKPGGSKRYHVVDNCPECQDGYTLNDCLHTMYIGGYSGESVARSLPWRHVERKPDDVWHDAPQNWEELQEQWQEFLALEEADRWN